MISVINAMSGWLADHISYLPVILFGGVRVENPPISKVFIALIVHLILTTTSVVLGIYISQKLIENDITHIKKDVEEQHQEIIELRKLHMNINR